MDRTMTLSVGGRARRWVDHAALVAVGAAALALVAFGVAMLFGFRALVVRSGSMQPAIETGDIVLSKVVAPSRIAAGDVVTFRDPTRPGKLITHRVVRVTPAAGGFDFVTKGDANTGIERWSVGSDGTVGRVALTLPKAGYALTWLGMPVVRVALLAAAVSILGAVALRRIWAG